MLIVLCEDTVKDMEALIDLCDAYTQKNGYIAHVQPYSHADKLLADPAAREADIMLLDIMMPESEGMDEKPAGMETARRLRAEGYRGAIIFTTSSEDYYPEGFEVGACHYLIKPVRYDEMALAMERALQFVKRPERMITVPVNRIQVSIAQSTIWYAEVYGRETVLHTTTEQVRVLLPLKKIEGLLDGDPFLRCYRSYIINMDYVKAMEEDHFVLEGGQQIPISLRSRQALRERYLAYRLSALR